MSDEIDVTVENENITVTVTPDSPITVEVDFEDVRLTIEESGLPGPPGPQGIQGIQGDPGPAGSGSQNLYIQETDPNTTGVYMWVELNPDDSIKTFWIKT